MTIATVPIFINAATVQAPTGSSLGTVLADHDPDLLNSLLDGSGEGQNLALADGLAGYLAVAGPG